MKDCPNAALANAVDDKQRQLHLLDISQQKGASKHCIAPLTKSVHLVNHCDSQREARMHIKTACAGVSDSSVDSGFAKTDGAAEAVGDQHPARCHSSGRSCSRQRRRHEGSC